jgi:hypothetical protein
MKERRLKDLSVLGWSFFSAANLFEAPNLLCYNSGILKEPVSSISGHTNYLTSNISRNYNRARISARVKTSIPTMYATPLAWCCLILLSGTFSMTAACRASSTFNL